jgi:glycosyltransferase involved in cell wall biosynthesis
MRIAQIAPIAERVPPEKYGGTERVISTLTEQLVKRGHEVTLFASGDSKTSAKLQSVFPVSLRAAKVQDLYGFNIPSMKNMGLAYAMHDQFDIIHDHNPHLSLPTANICPTPVVATWHGPYFPEVVEYFRLFPHVNLVSISQSQALAAPTLKFCANVYNGLVLNQSPFSEQSQGYLLYVGRIDREKGTHVAIDVAVRLKKKLIIAGKLDDDIPHIREYYIRYVRPRLRRHADLVTWIGEVDEAERNDLMKNSLCLLHPITWPEPFGLTLIESMACGAPVIAFRLGSIPEVIQDGRTGFVVDTFSQMVEAVGRLGQIDRRACREYALSRFNAERMADGYEAVYQKILQAKQMKGNQ